MTRKSNCARQRRNGGFSLVELMVSMSILSFGILGMLVMQTQALQQGTKGKQSTAALTIARDALEQLPRLPFSALPANDTWTAPAWISHEGLAEGDGDLADGVVPIRVADSADAAHFGQLYRVWYKVSPDPSTPSKAGVRQVEVQVIWSSANDVSVTPEGRTTQSRVSLSGFIVDNDL